MKRLLLQVIIGSVLFSCTENDFDKVTLPYTAVTGEYVVNLEIEDLGVNEEHNIRLFNVSNGTDSLWIEDLDFIETQVRVKWDGANKFSITQGKDILNGVDVNISGEVFPENDSIHVEWEYLNLDIGDDPQRYVVKANGVLYTGLTN